MDNFSNLFYLDDYIINGTDEIKKLKQDLMSEENINIISTINESNNNDNKDNLSLSQEIRKIINSEIGFIFEDNIKGILENKYNFQKSDIERNIIYREVKIGKNNDTIIIGKNKRKIIKLKGKEFIIQLNNDYSISLIEKKTNKLIETIEESPKVLKKIFSKDKLIFYPHKEIEIDGIYNLKDFNKLMFNSEEVSIIYDNIGKNYLDKNYDMAVLEIKLNPKKIDDLIKQLKKDAYYFKKTSEKNIIYIGFINCESVDSKIDFKKKLGNIECIIYGIKDSKLCGRNIKRNNDWVLVSEVKKLKEKMEMIEGRMRIIEDKVDKIMNLIEEDHKKVNEDKKEKKLIGKKRKKQITKQEEKEDDEFSNEADDEANDDKAHDDSLYIEFPGDE